MRGQKTRKELIYEKKANEKRRKESDFSGLEKRKTEKKIAQK